MLIRDPFLLLSALFVPLILVFAYAAESMALAVYALRALSGLRTRFSLAKDLP